MNVTIFPFGKNWLVFIKRYLNQEGIKKAKESLIEFCGDNIIRGKSFLDVGCGSGLYSLAAYQLGASRIVGFDVDSDSISASNYLREREGSCLSWEIKQGSILDEDFIGHIGRYDVVYCWGVVHHTGAMWKAIENLLRLVAENGILYLAVYNKVDHFGFYSDGRFGSSKWWAHVKKIYTRLPWALQHAIDYVVMTGLVMGYLIALKNPIQKIRNHTTRFRGMSWRVDIKDWLGGYPYEYASIDEIFHFVKRHGFLLENLRCSNGLRNNEYLFKKV